MEMIELGGGGWWLTCVAEVDELFGEQVSEQLHDEEEVLVLVLLRRGLRPPPTCVVLRVDLEQRQASLVQPHALRLDRERERERESLIHLDRREHLDWGERERASYT